MHMAPSRLSSRVTLFICLIALFAASAIQGQTCGLFRATTRHIVDTRLVALSTLPEFLNLIFFEEMPYHERVTGVALSLSMIYLICKDAFPTPQMNDEWATIVWDEAHIKTGTDLDFFPPPGLVSSIPTKASHVLTFRFSSKMVIWGYSLRRRKGPSTP